MATFDIDSSINSLPDTAVLPCFQGHSVVQAKLLDFGVFKPLGAKLVFEALSSFITSMEMVVIAHSDTSQPVPMHQMTLNDLHQAMRTKLRSEAQPLLGDEHVNVFDDLKAMVEVGDDSSDQAMGELQQLCLRSVLESISCANVKKGALYLCPFTEKPVLLLGSRGLFITDKNKVAAAVAKLNKSKKSSGKATAKKSNKKDGKATVNPQGKPRRTISDEEEEELLSNASIPDVSCHGGDGDSPYDSEWAHSPRSSAQATPVLGPQLQNEAPIPLTLTPAPQVHITEDAPRPPLNIQLTANPLAPLLPARIPLGALGPVNPLGGALGSVYMAASSAAKPSRKRSRKQHKSKKSKKARRSRSRSSSSSISSIEVPPPRPSVDQVFLCLYFPLSIDTVWVIISFTNWPFFITD